ncbi:MAG: ROK family protein [Bacilli bacterium]|nr:ROK family protein [Bacilli bacterium]
MVAIGIDIGGTSIKGAAVYSDGKMLNTFSLPVYRGDPGEKTVNDLIDLVEKYIKEHGLEKEIAGIGIGIPGTLDVDNGIVEYSNNLKWENLPITKLFQKRLPYKVRISNDANVAAFGEAKFGAGKGVPYSIMLTLGTGVGGGIVLDGKLYEGNLGKAAEMGHIVMEYNGRQCTCGRKGCLEAYASATAIVNDTKKAMEEHPESLMHQVAEELGKVDGRVAFKAARQGDKIAQQVVDQYIFYLSEGILNYCNIFRPNLVILSGGIANEGDYLFDKINNYLKVHNYGYKKTPEVKVVPAKLGYDSGKIGAASLFFK